MKLPQRNPRQRGAENRFRPTRRAGSALIIVLILLSLMAAMMVSNAVTLRRLKVELQRIEQKQKQRIAQLTDGAKAKAVDVSPSAR